MTIDGALVDPRAQAARVVEVHVRVDQVADRLVRDRFLHLRDDGQRALLGLRAFDDDDVVGLIDRETVVGAALQVEDAVGEFLGCDDDRRGTAAALTFSGTVASTAGFALTDETVRSSTGWPPCVRMMCPGN